MRLEFGAMDRRSSTSGGQREPVSQVPSVSSGAGLGSSSKAGVGSKSKRGSKTAKKGSASRASSSQGDGRRSSSSSGRKRKVNVLDGWDTVEETILRAAVKSYKEKNWDKIAKHLPGRTPVQCLSHWRTITNTQVTKGKGSWTPEEDERLKKVVEEHGPRNWATVIAPKLDNRLGKQCRERWHNHLDPQLKKTKWSLHEEKVVADAHDKFGNKWAQIAKLLPGRSDNDVKNHWYASIRRRKTRMNKRGDAMDRYVMRKAGSGAVSVAVPAKKQKTGLSSSVKSAPNETAAAVAARNLGRWTAQEGATLLSLVDKFGAKNWAFIAAHLPGRSDIQCLQHWRHVLNPNVVKGRGSWTLEEDDQLKSLVSKYGPKKWASAIAPHLPGRMGKQCRERWYNTLNPNLKKIAWTEEEDAILKQQHALVGNKWSLIAKHLKGRSDNDVKNHFYASLRRKKTRNTQDQRLAELNTPVPLSGKAPLTEKPSTTSSALNL